MSDPIPYVAQSQSMYLVESGRVTGHISMGGQILLIPVGRSGKTVAFEMHNQFGPWPVHKRTHDPLDNVPAGFWDAYELWGLGGKLVMGNVCVLPIPCTHCEGFGFMVDRSSGLAMCGPNCPKCDGNKCVHVTKGGE